MRGAVWAYSLGEQDWLENCPCPVAPGARHSTKSAAGHITFGCWTTTKESKWASWSHPSLLSPSQPPNDAPTSARGVLVISGVYAHSYTAVSDMACTEGGAGVEQAWYHPRASV